MLNLVKEVRIELKEVDIVDVKRLGTWSEEGVRPILVTLAEPSLKRIIFPATHDIRSKFQVYVDNDMTPPRRKEMAEVRAVRKKLIQNNIICKIKGFDIMIGGKPYNWQQATKVLHNLAVRSSQQSEESDSAQSENEMMNQQMASHSPVDSVSANKRKIADKSSDDLFNENAIRMKPPKKKHPKKQHSKKTVVGQTAQRNLRSNDQFQKPFSQQEDLGFQLSE